MFKPLRDKILVKPLEHKASDVLQVVSGDKTSLGEVVATGPKATDVRVGDRIRFGTTENYLTFPEWTDDAGQRYLILSEADVCFVEGAKRAA